MRGQSGNPIEAVKIFHLQQKQHVPSLRISSWVVSRSLLLGDVFSKKIEVVNSVNYGHLMQQDKRTASISISDSLLFFSFFPSKTGTLCIVELPEKLGPHCSIEVGTFRVPTWTGKPGKMGRHFPVREKSGKI